MLLDKDRLHAIGLQHEPSWATGNRLRDMQAPPKKAAAGSRKPEAGSRKPEAGGGAHDAGGRRLLDASPRCSSASALAVVLSKNLFHSVLWLALALVATAGIFLTLDAEFLAAVQVLLYAGGVVTVVVFAIVVTERLVGERLSHTSRRVATGGVVSAALLALLVRAICAARRRPAGAGRCRAT